MDLVDRLKLFIKESGIPVTQFADSCGIPRPTVSQIINGRNKKISDEIISKIHNAYPSLSIYWLMFGEGNPGNWSNIETSEGSDALKSGDTTHYNAIYQQDKNQQEKKYEYSEFTQSRNQREEQQVPSLFSSSNGNQLKKNEENKSASPQISINNNIQRPEKSQVGQNDKEELNRDLKQSESVTSILIPQEKIKKITNIVVFYNDNSFQSFSPSI